MAIVESCARAATLVGAERLAAAAMNAWEEIYSGPCFLYFC